MKNFSFKTIMLILAVFLFGGISNISAATVAPSTFTTAPKDNTKLAYIYYKTTDGTTDDYAIIEKKATDGSYVYCIDMKKKYDGGLSYTKTKQMDIGINYILNHKPNTGDPKKDYYITQMAIYYFVDYVNGNDNNLPTDFKKIIVIGAKVEDTTLDKQTKEVCKEIYKLYVGAYNYRKEDPASKKGYINITTTSVSFTKKDGFYTSSKIYLKSGNLNGDIKKVLTNATPNTKVYRDTADNGYIIKIPVNDIPQGKKVTFSLTFSGNYKEEATYYYYTDDGHQRLIYDKVEVTEKPVSAKITLTVKNYTDSFDIKISKTDVTKQKELPGATLVLKDENGNQIDKWVSTNTAHIVKVLPGDYSLTETIAPKGYKLSRQTIKFRVDTIGYIYILKDGQSDSDNKVKVDKVTFVNELKDKIKISKTDVTQTKEIPGATLVLKDANGKEIEKWVSTNTAHEVVLDAGEYSLTETIAPAGYKLSTTTIYFKVDEDGTLYNKVNGKYVKVNKINMINELENITSIAKKDINTDVYVAGATMVIRDSKGNIVKQFVSTNSVYQLTLSAGDYTLEEIAAPTGYILSKDKLYFRVLENGSLQVKNSNGVYEDSVMVVFYNTPEKDDDVPVPSTGKSTILITIAGITLLITGVAYVIKTTKEC